MYLSIKIGRYYTNHVLKFIILYWDFQNLEELMWYGLEDITLNMY